MNAFIARIQIIGGPIPVVIAVLAVIAAVALALGKTRRWFISVAAALLIGAAVGLLLCWVIGDLRNAFDVTLSPITRAWVAVAFGGVGLAVLNLWRSRPRRKVGAVAAILLFALLGAIGVNADFGQYTTIGSITGASAYDPIPDSALATQKNALHKAPPAGATTSPAQLWQTWNAPAGMPSQGTVGTVTIPGSVSHFPARNAIIYLPPAALVAHPPALPVLMMLSGQPGSPENVFAAGHLDVLLDEFAAQHGGLAPIVVVPDQLSAPTVNPMCVDSAIGNSATYLTVDVPTWIKAHLDVETTTAAWGIGGFSQGGTCAIQLGAGHPQLFGSIFDVSGELEPKIGSVETTIDRGFAGSAAAYEAAKPLSIIAHNTPFANMVGVFAVGELDAKYTPEVDVVSSAASAAGMSTTVLTSPGTAHDWWTVNYAFKNGMPKIYEHMGLIESTKMVELAP